MKRITITALAIVSVLLMASCATAAAEQAPEPTEEIEFAYVCDWNQHTDPSIVEQIAADVEQREAERIAAEEQAAAEAAAAEEAAYWEAYYAEQSYSTSYSGDGFMQEGVRSGVDSATETWYSSNAAYHYRTSEWSPDDEGYYRDSDGYYVVASNDYPEGSVVTTSKGEAKVYDSGTDSGNIDMYVNW